MKTQSLFTWSMLVVLSLAGIGVLFFPHGWHFTLGLHFLAGLLAYHIWYVTSFPDPVRRQNLPTNTWECLVFVMISIAMGYVMLLIRACLGFPEDQPEQRTQRIRV